MHNVFYNKEKRYYFQNKMEFQYLHEFIRALLFGNKTFYLTPGENVLINQLLIDIRKKIDVEETIRKGGLFDNHLIIMKDLDKIINFIERGNKYFFDKYSIKNETINLESSLVRTFFHNLNRVCRADIDDGVISNKYKRTPIPIPEKSDEETLEHLLKNETDNYLTFQNAEFWGIVAKNLIQKQRPYKVLRIGSPLIHLKNIQCMYNMKCQSLGEIINPYSFTLVPYNSFVDPIHWQSVKALKLFIEHFPENNLSRTCRELVNATVKSIMKAEEDLLPKNILDDEIQLLKFIKNIERIHNKIEKVESPDTPLKVIDVIHRLLALLQYDYMWESLTLSTTTDMKSSNILINMYLKNAELERENKLLHQKLKNDPNINIDKNTS